jgi:ABC-type transport system involved in multi-copper enzyme maturation permease subunit
MTWLIWKDYRLNRVILWVALGLLVAPHLLAVYVTWRETAPSASAPPLPPLAANLLRSGTASLVLLQLTMALVGGNAIACERADRSAEFLAYLPVARGRILVSKLLVVLGLIALIWLPNLVIMGIAVQYFPEQVIAANSQEAVHLAELARNFLGGTAVAGLLCFTAAWLFSSFLDSPTFSIAAGLVAPALLMMGLGLVGEYVWAPAWSPTVAVLLSLAVSTVSFTVGTIYYLRRVEP